MKLTRKQLGDREDLYLSKAAAAAAKARAAGMRNPPRRASVHYWHCVEAHHREQAWHYCKRIDALYQGI